MKLLSIFLSLSLIIFSQQADAIAIDAKVSEVTAGSNVACTIIFTLTSDTSTTKKTIGKIGGLVLAKSSDATSTTPLTCTLASAKEISVGANEFSCTAGTLAEGKYKLAKSTTAGEYKITTDTGGATAVDPVPTVTGTNEITVKAASNGGSTGGNTNGGDDDDSSKFLSVSSLLFLMLFF